MGRRTYAAGIKNAVRQGLTSRNRCQKWDSDTTGSRTATKKWVSGCTPFATRDELLVLLRQQVYRPWQQSSQTIQWPTADTSMVAAMCGDSCLFFSKACADTSRPLRHTLKRESQSAEAHSGQLDQRRCVLAKKNTTRSFLMHVTWTNTGRQFWEPSHKRGRLPRG